MLEGTLFCFIYFSFFSLKVRVKVIILRAKLGKTDDSVCNVRKEAVISLIITETETFLYIMTASRK